MKTIVIASQKGGVGKTTLAGHLSVQAERTGAGPVVVIDTDPQGSLTWWWNARQAEAPGLVQATGDLPRQLADLKQSGVRLVVIDTPPAASDWTLGAIQVADLVLIPTRPSPHDLHAVGATVEMVEVASRKMVFVINGAPARAKITGEAAIALSQHGKVAPVTIFQRVDFASSMIDGRTVQELDPKSRSAGEIAQLWEYLNTQLRK